MAINHKENAKVAYLHAKLVIAKIIVKLAYPLRYYFLVYVLILVMDVLIVLLVSMKAMVLVFLAFQIVKHVIQVHV